jgi:DNA topoisomerase VI subunit A
MYVSTAKQIKDMMFTGTLKYRDIMNKNHKQPRDVLDRDINYRDIMTKNQSYTYLGT